MKTENIEPTKHYNSLENLRNNIAADEEGQKILEYFHALNITFLPRRGQKEKENLEVELRVWYPFMSTFPGHNPPAVEVYIDEKRVAFQVLNEIPRIGKTWAAADRGNRYLYVQARYRFREARGIHVYKFNPESFAFDHQGVVFTEEELQREVEYMENLKERLFGPNWQNSRKDKEAAEESTEVKDRSVAGGPLRKDAALDVDGAGNGAEDGEAPAEHKPGDHTGESAQ
ncbi:MAG: hypothetical protein JJU29_13285 [Verrucomicrobia bacterium]|nr:hypothetical protein [Verrucomicrobiota bacterium]